MLCSKSSTGLIYIYVLTPYCLLQKSHLIPSSICPIHPSSPDPSSLHVNSPPLAIQLESHWMATWGWSWWNLCWWNLRWEWLGNVCRWTLELRWWEPWARRGVGNARAYGLHGPVLVPRLPVYRPHYTSPFGTQSMYQLRRETAGAESHSKGI